MVGGRAPLPAGVRFVCDNAKFTRRGGPGDDVTSFAVGDPG